MINNSYIYFHILSNQLKVYAKFYLLRDEVCLSILHLCGLLLNVYFTFLWFIALCIFYLCVASCSIYSLFDLCVAYCSMHILPLCGLLFCIYITFVWLIVLCIFYLCVAYCFIYILTLCGFLLYVYFTFVFLCFLYILPLCGFLLYVILFVHKQFHLIFIKLQTKTASHSPPWWQPTSLLGVRIHCFLVNSPPFMSYPAIGLVRRAHWSNRSRVTYWIMVSLIKREVACSA